MPFAPVIFLNGTSSSGKTTLAKAFQKAWNDPSLYASVDAFIFMLGAHTLADDPVRRGILPRLLSAFHRSLPVLADCGLPVIIDHVLESKDWLAECAEALKERQVYFVGVRCPLSILEEREKARGDRQIGFARWQFERVHRYGAYDLEIDTARTRPEQAANELIGWLRSGGTPTAFDRIRQEASCVPGR